MPIEIVNSRRLRRALFLSTADLSKDLIDDRIFGRGPTLGTGTGGAWI